MPIGGIWLDGRRDRARVNSALRSGRPAATMRDVPSGAVGTTQWPAVQRGGDGVGRAAIAGLGVNFRNSPSDAIVLCRLWQLPQLVER